MLTIRDALVSDAEVIGKKLRECDNDEIEALFKRPPVEIVKMSIEDSKSGYGFVKLAFMSDDPVMIFGVAPLDDPYGDTGVPWAMATDALQEHSEVFMKLAPKWIEHMLNCYPHLINVVDARNRVSIRWLKKMGFTFNTLHESYGEACIPFYEFTKDK